MPAVGLCPDSSGQKIPPLLRWYFCGGEKGIRTLDTISSIHDFQSCALDQLSHLSIRRNGLVNSFCLIHFLQSLSTLKGRFYIIINLRLVVKRKSLTRR